MAIAAVKVMAAGKAGLEAMPYFVSEFIGQGYSWLPPLGLDHDETVIGEAIRHTNELVGGNKLGEICRRIEPERNGRADFLLNAVNPQSIGAGLADSPARLAAWCRVQLQEICNDVVDEWTQFSNQYRPETTSDTDPLLIVIPYCPEGPTSGTIGMYLGAMLRKTFEQSGMYGRLLVCGVELSPPIDASASDELTYAAGRNVFRGFVARQEVQQGVPLTDQPDDDDYRQCFDIHLIFDGSAETEERGIRPAGVWRSMDRAAAQSTALLFKGAANDRDVMESANMLRERGPWEVTLVHVVSDREYSPALRCQRYRRQLPWHSISGWWRGKNRPNDKKTEFINAIASMEPEIEQEPDDDIRYWFNEIKKHVGPLERINSGFLDLFGSNKKQINGLLDAAEAADEEGYAEIRDKDKASDSLNFQLEPYCINIQLTEELRRKIIESATPIDIATLVGNNAQARLRNDIGSLIEPYLSRPDCEPLKHDSKAFFEQIVTVSVVKEGSLAQISQVNRALRPFEANVKYFLGKEDRGSAGSYTETDYEIRHPDAPLTWRPRNLERDIPVEYTLLVIARLRESDGFKDLYNYAQMHEQYKKIAADSEESQHYMRYYGIRPPEPGNLLWDEPELPPGTERSQTAEAGAGGSSYREDLHNRQQSNGANESRPQSAGESRA